MSEQPLVYEQSRALSRQSEPLTVFQWGALYGDLPMSVIASCMWEASQATSSDGSRRHRDVVIAELLEAISQQRSGARPVDGTAHRPAKTVASGPGIRRTGVVVELLST
jgi:hypothetical protein